MAVLIGQAKDIVFPGVAVDASNSVLIADPGWADYGVTPDQFARMNVTMALNPLPIDSNRAVHGLSAHKTLAEVTAVIKAKGPLNVVSPQAVKELTPAERVTVEQKFFASGLSCKAVFKP